MATRSIDTLRNTDIQHVVGTDGQDYTHVLLHDHMIVLFSHDIIQLDSCGYKTPTTKRRMNQAADEFGLNFFVYQDCFTWYVQFNGKSILFEDKMTLTRED